MDVILNFNFIFQKFYGIREKLQEDFHCWFLSMEMKDCRGWVYWKKYINVSKFMCLVIN